jgi:ankyrin repeat protein
MADSAHDDTYGLPPSPLTRQAEMKYRRQCLVAAARRGDEEQVRELLDEPGAEGMSLDFTMDGHNPFPLYLAARGGHEGVVRLLLERGAEIDARNPGSAAGRTALVGAAEKGHEGVVRALLERGADATVETRHGTAEDLASTEAIQALLRVSER